MTLPSALVLKKNSSNTAGSVNVPVSTLTMSFINNHTLTLWGDGQELAKGLQIDVWLWMVSEIDTLHPLYRSFEDVMNPTFGMGWFYTELDKAGILSDKSAQGRVQWLWDKMHEPQLMSSMMQRLTNTTDNRHTILDGVFPFVVMYQDASLLHKDPLWMAWWQRIQTADHASGAKVLENLCLSGQAAPVPAFVAKDQRARQMVQFFEHMQWDTLVARQIFAGVRTLAEHFKCEMPELLQNKNLTPAIGRSLIDQPKRWDNILGPWCTNRPETIGSTTIAWFSYNLARNYDFLFFREPYQQQWLELQRRGLAPNMNLSDFQQQLSHSLDWDLRSKEIPYEYRPERVLTAAVPLIEKAVLIDTLQNDTLPPKNASSSRRKM